MRLVLGLALATMLAACSRGNDTLQVSGAWIAEAPPAMPMRAGYAVIANPGRTPRSLCRFESPDFAEIEMHRSTIVDGVAHMQALPQLEIPAGGKVRFEPGGLHLMLMRPARAFKAGDRVTISLGCGQSAPLNVVFEVQSTP